MNWNEYQKNRINISGTFPKYVEIDCKCPKCNAEHIYKNISEVLTSYPPQFYYVCKNCDWVKIGY